MIGEVNLSCMEPAGLRQDNNGQNGIIEFWMLEMDIIPGVVDKSSLQIAKWWFDTIKPSTWSLCDCLGVNQAILSQVCLEVLAF